jgi:NodT family efflux transporter outer membrane factor (OMF) lipoprotein
MTPSLSSSPTAGLRRPGPPQVPRLGAAPARWGRPAKGSAIAAALALAGCGSVPTPVPPPGPPAAWHQAAARPDAAGTLPAPELRAWWKHLADPQLDSLVEQALAQNLGIAQARSRLRQARQLLGRDSAVYQPALGASARTVQDAAAVDSYFHAGLDVTWELGLFGARAAVEGVGQARIDSAAAAEQAARVSTVAEVVRRYIELQAARRDEALLQRLMAVDERLLALHGVRQRVRLGSVDEGRATELRLAQTRALLAAPRLAAAQAAQALALLLGRAAPDPAWGATAAATAPLSPFRLQEVPADLLRFRPDVRAAEVEVARAGAELGIARSELYPRVVLGVSRLYAYNLTQNRRTLNSTVTAIGPIIDVPLFDWGRRAAAARAQHEALDGAVLAWRQAVLEAVAETEGALAALAATGERTQALAAAASLLERTRERQAMRQRLGLAAAPETLEAERQGLQAQLELQAAHSAQAQAFVLLYKSLGGAPLAGAEAPATAASALSPSAPAAAAAGAAP